MTTLDDLRAEALFCSDLQPSQHPTGELVRATVDEVEDRIGEARCADLLAQESGDHPEVARDRMRWSRRAVAEAFFTDLAGLR